MNTPDLFHKRPIRPDGETAARGTPVRMETARVLSVDKDKWTINAQPEGDDHIITDVPLLTPYEHVDGSGIYFLPRRGAQGLLVYYDRGGPRFLCFRSEALGQGTFKGNKHDLDEGDMILKSAYGSNILLRDTGIVEVYSNPVLRMALLPYTNTWFAQGEQMDLSMVGGRWQWTHRRGARPVSTELPFLESTGKTTLSEEYRELAAEDPILFVGKGWHDNRAAYSVRYEEADDSRVLWQIGKIDGSDLLNRTVESDGGDDRVLLDVDDGSYVRTIGERGDGTVVRTKVTGRSDTNRDWSKETKIGRQSDGTIVEERIEAGPETDPKHVDLKIKQDGQIDLSVNGALTVNIGADGSTTMNIQQGSFLKIACEDIRLGSVGEDEPDQPAILGNLFKAYLNDEVLQPLHDWLSTHKGIGNLGAPISPPLPAELTSILNLIGAMGSGKMDDDVLSDRVRIDDDAVG